MKIILFILLAFNLFASDLNQSILSNTTNITSLQKEIESLKKENILLKAEIEKVEWKRDSDINAINNRVEAFGNYLEENGKLVTAVIGFFSILMTVLVIFLTLKSNKEAKLIAKDEAENEIEKWIDREAKTHIEATKKELNDYMKHIKKANEEIENLVEESKYKVLIEEDDIEISMENKEILRYEVKIIKLKAIVERTFQDNLKIIFFAIANKNYKEAENHIDSLILKYKSDFELSRLYYLRAVIADKQLKEDEAIKYYEASISKSNKYSDPYRQLAIFYTLVKQDYEKAIELFKKAIEINPNDYKAYVRFGVTLRFNKNIEEAIKLYKKAIEINPDFSLAYNNLSSTKKRDKERERKVVL